MKKLQKIVILLLKIAGSLGLIGFLLYRAINAPGGRQAFVNMLAQQKAWGLLAEGFNALLAAILITLVRWWYLVRAVGIGFSLRDAMRIGFLGYLFNLAPMGIVGGDLLKAWLLAKEKPGDRADQPSNRAKALASVIVDRIIGLYVLFLVALFGVFYSGFWQLPDPVVHGICVAVCVATAVATAGVGVMLIPGVLGGPLTEIFGRIPKIGPAIKSLFDAIKIYRAKRAVLVWTALATIPVHTLLTVSIYLLALGLRFDQLDLSDYFGVYPVSGILSTIPLPAGPQETGIVFLYTTAALTRNVLQATAEQQGLILALVYRLSTILIAPIGAAYYFLGARSEVQDVMHDIDESGDAERAASPD